MKTIFVFISLLFITNSYSSSMMYCEDGQYMTYNGQIVCKSQIPHGPPTYCATCGGWNYNSYTPYQSYNYFPTYPFYNQNMMNTGYNPWYAQQAQLYYPNYYYPGAWNHGNQGIDPNHYPGGGGGWAAKPNVYVQNAIEGQKHVISFAKEQVGEMLVTTPALDKEDMWQTKLSADNKFEVAGVKYDYLFYDLRFDHKKLQYKHGFCSDRKTIIEYMQKDLNELQFPKTSQEDFAEHWNQKIPNIEFYCLYPQYNEQLDKAYPIHVSPQLPIVRTLYLVVPHYERPKVSQGKFPPLPIGKPDSIRGRIPSSEVTQLKEWGVAFLMQGIVKN